MGRRYWGQSATPWSDASSLCADTAVGLCPDTSDMRPNGIRKHGEETLNMKIPNKKLQILG